MARQLKRWEVRLSDEQKIQEKSVNDGARLFKWMIYRPELIRFLMEMEDKHRRDNLSRQELLKIEYLLFKNGQH